MEELRHLVDMRFYLSSVKEGFSSSSNLVFSEPIGYKKIFSAILQNFNLLPVTQNHFSYCKFNRFREKLVLFSECLVILYREKIAIFGNVYMILEKILKIFSKEKKNRKNN